jgi:hypothetical protein
MGARGMSRCRHGELVMFETITFTLVALALALPGIATALMYLAANVH